MRKRSVVYLKYARNYAEEEEMTLNHKVSAEDMLHFVILVNSLHLMVPKPFLPNPLPSSEPQLQKSSFSH